MMMGAPPPQQINYKAFDWIIFPIKIVVNLNLCKQIQTIRIKSMAMRRQNKDKNNTKLMYCMAGGGGRRERVELLCLEIMK